MDDATRSTPISESPDNSASGFVIFCDIERYSSREDELDIAAMTRSLCEAAMDAARIARLDAVAFQCTGDGFIAAPKGARPNQVLKFIDQTVKEFNPERYGGTADTGTARIRWGVDYGTYQLVETFGTRNVAGRAPIASARVGSVGDGGHVLVTAEAREKFKDASSDVEPAFTDLGLVRFKHGYARRVYLRGSKEDPKPHSIKRRHSSILCVQPFLRRFGLSFIRSVPVKGIKRPKCDSQAVQVAEQLKLRASLLLPTDDGLHIMVHDVRDRKRKHRSVFRATFGHHRPEAEGPGTTHYQISPPKGVPALAFRTALAQAMINLPLGHSKGYADAVLHPQYEMFCWERADIDDWSRKAQNFVAIPLAARRVDAPSEVAPPRRIPVDSNRGNGSAPPLRVQNKLTMGDAFGVISLDFDGAVTIARDELLNRISQHILDESELGLDFAALELLTARIIGA